jgi:hypothetical protein
VLSRCYLGCVLNRYYLDCVLDTPSVLSGLGCWTKRVLLVVACVTLIGDLVSPMRLVTNQSALMNFMKMN